MALKLQAPGGGFVTMANTPRPAADGMDSEVLKQQDQHHPAPMQLRINPPSSQRQRGSTTNHRHRNLNFSPNSTSFSKVPSAKYIPHEPVKGAVKAVTQRTAAAGFLPDDVRKSSTAPGSLSPNRKVPKATTSSDFSKEGTPGSPLPNLSAPHKDSRPFHHPRSNNHVGKASLNFVSDQTGHSNLTSEQQTGNEYPQMTISDAVATKSVSVGVTVGRFGRDMVKSIEVPVYNAPGHLSAKTYQTINNYQKQRTEKDFSKTITPKTEDHLVLNMNSRELSVAVDETVEIDTDCRSVEGRDKSSEDNVQNEIDSLRAQLQMQTKVNGDLKKLLVASMGEDLHYRVECLVRTNAQLSEDLGLYSHRISQDGENMDQLGIQADVWRSKYHASRVQVEELLALKASLSRLHEDSCLALEELLRERYQLRDSLFHTYRILQQLCDAFEPLPPAPRPSSFAPQSVTDIAARNYKLADGVKFRLLGALKLYPALYNMSTPNVMTPAEQMALQVLCEKPAEHEVDSASVDTSTPFPSQRPACTPQDATAGGRFSRYNPHPYTRYDNVTFNCCASCTGEIHVV